jgi:hypothetical protein
VASRFYELPARRIFLRVEPENAVSVPRLHNCDASITGHDRLRHMGEPKAPDGLVDLAPLKATADR